MRIPVNHEHEEQPELLPEHDPPPPAEEPPAEEEAIPFVMGPATPAEPAADYRDLYLRAMADMANFRRRTEQRADERVEEERRRLLQEILEFADNLERALQHLDEPGLRQGVRLTWEGLRRFLEREGVEVIAAAGQPFDPQVHEAVSVVADAASDGQVVREVRRGYRYHGRLLRPARVIVARA
jgi:molecular chaperone GrpE